MAYTRERATHTRYGMPVSTSVVGFNTTSGLSMELQPKTMYRTYATASGVLRFSTVSGVALDTGLDMPLLVRTPEFFCTDDEYTWVSVQGTTVAGQLFISEMRAGLPYIQ